MRSCGNMKKLWSPTCKWVLVVLMLSFFSIFAFSHILASTTDRKLLTTNHQLPTTFTNHAGHAVSGRLTALTNGTVVINGRAYPLSIFPDSEQARMRELLRVPLALTPALENRRRALRERLLRSEALLKAGAKTSEAAAAQRSRLKATWRHALDSSAIDPVTRAYWLDRLSD